MTNEEWQEKVETIGIVADITEIAYKGKEEA